MDKRNFEEGYCLTEAWKHLQPEGSEMPDDYEFSAVVYATTSPVTAMHPVAAADDGSNFDDEMAHLQASRVAAGILATATSLDLVYIPIVKNTQPHSSSEYFAVTAMARSTVFLTMIVFVLFVAGTIISRGNWRSTRGKLETSSCQPCKYRRRTRLA